MVFAARPITQPTPSLYTSRHFMSRSLLMKPTLAFAASPAFFQAQIPRRFFSPDGGIGDSPTESGADSQPEYIKTMKETQDW